MKEFEKLGMFYLGAEYDLSTGKRSEMPFLYDSRDLVTHAVIVGMTGSGKTGLGICLLEEAAIDAIPSIVIDPKGDLSNLLLGFPQLASEDFRRWINEDDARNKGIEPEEFASQQATLWREGLASWGQDASRIQRFQQSVDARIFTPGSNAGLPVALLQTFSAPPKEVLDDPETYRQRISSTVSGLLSLLGIDAAQPLQSREHILLSTILETNWRQGRSIDLAALIHQIQEPPFKRVGVIDTETFYPAKERFLLSMAINNLLAAPGFDLWLKGQPLDAGRLLYTAEGKPRISIFSISHLNDSERMFFVTLLLTELLGWIRTQPGTSSLRAILYMDEIFGYFPPVANPPAKQPLLTLLKQARAFGLGLVLATQNPVDLDYKGLANTGTWFIGRLQTERDKSRLIDGLQSVTGGTAEFNQEKIDQTLSALATRKFLMRNIHEENPVVFESRWSLSYLRGPLTRDEIRTLMDPVRDGSETPAEQVTPVVPAPSRPGQSEQSRPVLPPEVSQYFMPVDPQMLKQGELLYRPMLVAVGKMFYADAKLGIATEHVVGCAADFPEYAITVDWGQSQDLKISESDLERFAAEDAMYEPPTAAAAQPKNYAAWGRQFADWLYSTRRLDLWKSSTLDQSSHPGESERDFRIRLQQFAREARDRAVEKLRQRYFRRIESLQERIRRAEQIVQRESQQASQQKMQTAISFGTTVLGALFGRKRLSGSTLGRATTAARGVGRTMKESQDIGRAQETVKALQQQLFELEEQMRIETEELSYKFDPQNLQLQPVQLRPKKANVQVRFIGLAWMPFVQDSQGGIRAAITDGA